MGWIILLIIIGILLFIAELVLLPGLTIAAIGSFCSLVGAVAWAFAEYGVRTGFIVLGIVIVILIILLALFLRPRTWNRISLKTNIEAKVDEEGVQKRVAVGTEGMTLTRLAPMGNIEIDGKIYEAKSLDSYINQRIKVVVTGYDNNTLIVRQA